MTEPALWTRADRIVQLLARRAAVVLCEEGRLAHGVFLLDSGLELRSGISFDPPGTPAGVARLRALITALVDERKPWGVVLVAPSAKTGDEHPGEPLACIDLQARDHSVRLRAAFVAGAEPQPTLSSATLDRSPSEISMHEVVAGLVPFDSCRWLAELARDGTHVERPMRSADPDVQARAV